MRKLSSIVSKLAFDLIEQAVIYLPEDVKSELHKAYLTETGEIGRIQLKAILDNIDLAESHSAPICQDTGTIIFYLKAGAQIKKLNEIEEALVQAVKRATIQIPLRPNAVDPFTNKNSGDNTGRFVPQIHWEIMEGNCLEITVMIKGGGSENACALGMLNPGEGLMGLKRFVLESVVKAGAQPCPPTILGVAVGGGADEAIFLAKKALLKPLTEINKDAKIAAIEQELLDSINLTGIGPMGLGGKTSTLRVHIDYAFRHPASFPVAVAFSCWACRRASARINADGQIQFLSHKRMDKK